MVKLIFFILYLIGFALVFTGDYYGRMQVYLLEPSFWKSLLASGGTLGMRSSFMKHMNILKDYWYVVAWVGWFHLFVTSLLLWQLKCKLRAFVDRGGPD